MDMLKPFLRLTIILYLPITFGLLMPLRWVFVGKFELDQDKYKLILKWGEAIFK